MEGKTARREVTNTNLEFSLADSTDHPHDLQLLPQIFDNSSIIRGKSAVGYA
jgi:hypothetical protein